MKVPPVKALSGAAVAAVLASAISANAAKPPLNCGAKPDKHQMWEVVYRTEPTLAKAKATLARAEKAHFNFKSSIEVESCTAYEVATARFPSKASAQKHLNQVRAKGFRQAHLEES
jgi:hypothetical protein